MAQSVKLKDGSYIDAAGVWDATKSETQNTINSRLGTVIQGSWSAGSITTTSSTAGVNICTMSLPAGKWLVIAHYEDTVGWLSLVITATNGVIAPLMMGRHIGQTYSDTLSSFLVCNGNQNVTMRLGFLSPSQGKTYSWSVPNNLIRFHAICIG